MSAENPVAQGRPATGRRRPDAVPQLSTGSVDEVRPGSLLVAMPSLTDPTFADYAFYDPDDFPLFHSSQVNQGTADTRATLNISGFVRSAQDVNVQRAAQTRFPNPF